MTVSLNCSSVITNSAFSERIVWKFCATTPPPFFCLNMTSMIYFTYQSSKCSEINIFYTLFEWNSSYPLSYYQTTSHKWLLNKPLLLNSYAVSTIFFFLNDQAMSNVQYKPIKLDLSTFFILFSSDMRK